MRLYTLWKVDPHAHRAARLEHDGMPVLFEHAAEAEAYGLQDPEVWDEEVRVIPVTVGQA
jgi:hypothetical protein